MFDKFFALLGNGDVMVGMKYAMFGFMGILAVILIIVVLNIMSNYKDDKKKTNVSLTSKKAEEKKEERKKGVFNYTLISHGSPAPAPSGDEQLKTRALHKHDQAPRPGSRAAATANSTVPHLKKVSLKKADTPHVEMHRTDNNHAAKHAVNYDDNPFATPIDPSSLRKDNDNEQL
jgi:hypothetical protein